jgi:hypothetical protein
MTSPDFVALVREPPAEELPVLRRLAPGADVLSTAHDQHHHRSEGGSPRPAD